ncbi:MFS transporter [Breznakiella homolactica]|uniref:MFS transporter n=1 Tax=Breznakiella homolactica TaxID=2798577 RepID=A0A7T7XQS5_9SPIR|nr:MFS transporter [Breznakiella homolactica]QQO10771.1 MFS transporter [Breznakiella homolactica]
MVRSEKKSPLFSKKYLMGISVNLMVCTFGQMLMCAMPLLIAGGGHGIGYSGLAVSAFSFGAVLFRPITGWLASKLPGRKTVSFCLIFFSVSCLVLFCSPPLWLTIVFRAAQGIVMSIYGTIYGALVSYLIPSDRFQEGMGYYSIGVPAMSFLGPALGLVAIELAGERVMFLFLAFFTFAAAFICYRLDVRDEPVTPPLPKGETNLFRITFAGEAFFPSIMLMLVFVAHTSLVSFLSIFAASRGYEGTTTFYLLAGAGIIAVRLVFTMIPFRLNEQTLIIPALAALGVCTLVMAHLPQGIMLYCTALVYGCSLGIVQPGLIADAIGRSPPERRAAATATYYLALDLGAGVGGLLWAAVARAGGYIPVYYLASVIIFTVMIILVFVPALRTAAEKAS